MHRGLVSSKSEACFPPQSNRDTSTSTLKLKLVPGTMRHAHQCTAERTVESQLENLDERQRYCFESLKALWNDQCPDDPISDDLFLRYV